MEVQTFNILWFNLEILQGRYITVTNSISNSLKQEKNFLPKYDFKNLVTNPWNFPSKALENTIAHKYFSASAQEIMLQFCSP